MTKRIVIILTCIGLAAAPSASAHTRHGHGHRHGSHHTVTSAKTRQQLAAEQARLEALRIKQQATELPPPVSARSRDESRLQLEAQEAQLAEEARRAREATGSH